MSPLYRIRKWQRRVDTINRNLADLLSETIDVYGVDDVVCGESLTGHVDDVLASGQNLAGLLENAARQAKQK